MNRFSTIFPIRLYFFQRLIEIFQQILTVLQPNTHADKIIRHAGIGFFFFTGMDKDR